MLFWLGLENNHGDSQAEQLATSTRSQCDSMFEMCNFWCRFSNTWGPLLWGGGRRSYLGCDGSRHHKRGQHDTWWLPKTSNIIRNPSERRCFPNLRGKGSETWRSRSLLIPASGHSTLGAADLTLPTLRPRGQRSGCIGGNVDMTF